LGDISVPNVGVGRIFSFDLGAVNSAKSLYYVTDRTNASVDVFNTRSMTLVTQIKGTGALAFTGIARNKAGAIDSTRSGPDGINIIPGVAAGSYFVYAGDVNKVEIIDSTSNTIIGSVVVGGRAAGTLASPPGSAGLRADEGCYDSVHRIYVITTPDVDNTVLGQTPYLSVFDVSTPSAPTLKAVITFFDATDPTGTLTTAGNPTPSAGLEQCAYDAVNDQFLINNDGTIKNPLGEIDAFSGAAVAAIPAGTTVNYTALAGYKVYAAGAACNPRGLALGPGTTPATAEFAVECSAVTGKPMITLIYNRLSGTILATVPFGGGDALEYDAATNRYYATGSGWNDTGIKSATTAQPALGIIDAASHTLVAKVPTGNGAHSVAVDGTTFRAFVPYSYPGSPSTPLCTTCAARFPKGGVSVFATQ
jgi:hypothetical protein